MRLIAIAAAMYGVAACAASPAPPPRVAADTSAVRVMVVGTWHFSGSKSDIISTAVDSPLTPLRQQELDDAVSALAAFGPTALVVERVTAAPDYLDPAFARFTAADLLANEDERVQLGYRLAAKAGVTRVYGIDEQPSTGEPDYFPFAQFMEHAARTGQGDAANAMIERAQTLVGEETLRLSALTMREALIEANIGLMSSPDFYYEMLKLDVGESQPAAELNAYWFMRNAKIFSKIADVTKPGDRVVVIYGAGHKHLLDHLIEHTPGFERVDPADYLRAK